jgi:uncharacterized protein (TIGR02145 family)
LTLTATFEPEYDGVAIVMSTGTIEWAKTNLSGYQTFAPNETDSGCLFQWGYDNAIPTTGTATGWHSTEYAGDEWHGGQGPCPSGWRLPTRGELNNLINMTANTSGAGTTSGTWTTTSWTTGASGGATITPKSGDTTKTLFFPAAGFRRGSTGVADAQDTEGHYWSYTPHDVTTAYRLGFYGGASAGNVSAASKLYGFSVRCVRPVE